MRFVYEKNKKVSELVKKYGSDYGFNFPFFYNGEILGDAKDGDKIVSSGYGKMLKWNSFGFQNEKPIIGFLDKNKKYDFLVQGSPLLIENGNLCYEYYIKHDETAPDIAQSRCQRTAVGIDAEGNLIVVVTDGRTSESKGLSIKELATFMKSKNCVQSLAGDGGGSSILCARKGMINKQSEERIVHGAVLINEL